MTKKELRWWHNHWLVCAKSCRKAGSRRSAANYLTCAAASGVTFNERYNMPVVAEIVEREARVSS